MRSKYEIHEDDDSRRDSRPDEQRSLGRRLAVATLLLALTLSGAVAARVTMRTGGATTSATSFHAAGTGPVYFRGQLDRSSVLVGGDGLVNMELVIGADALPGTDVPRIPTDLMVVLDRSGSMQGDAMRHALASVRELISRLSSEDRFSLVTYASDARIVVPFTRATPEARQHFVAALAGVQVGGGTNMAGGLDLGATHLAAAVRSGRAPRVILVSDGHANEGDHSREGLLARAARAVGSEYVLSAVGVGPGFDESLMSAMADAGTGNFFYVQRSDELGAVFASEFAAARETVASALRVDVALAPGIELVSAGGYPLERDGAHVRFRPGDLFAGQERRVWLALRVPAAAGSPAVDTLALGDFSLDFEQGGAHRALALDGTPSIARVVEEATFIAGVDDDLWSQAVVEEELGEVKQSVARALKSGDRDGALDRIESFKQKQTHLNRSVRSPAVARALERVDEIEAEVSGAFESGDAAVKNELGKQYFSDGTDMRRKGAKR